MPSPRSTAHPSLHEPTRGYVIAAWLITAFLMWFVLRFDLLPALIAGLTVYELVHVLTPRLTFVRERRARVLAVTFLSVLVVGLVGIMVVGAIWFFRSDTGGYVALLRKSSEIIQSLRGLVPAWAAHL